MSNYYGLHFPTAQKYQNIYKYNARVLVKKTYILEQINFLKEAHNVVYIYI